MNETDKAKDAFKWVILGLICIVATIVVATLKPIPQSQAYHHFADSRHLLGIPNVFDVLSNLPFIVVGLLGFVFTLNPRSTIETPQRWAYAVLFAGLLLTGFGSGYYHLSPDNQRLVADRLPMTVAMAGFITALLCDRFSAKSLSTPARENPKPARAGDPSLWMLPLLLIVGIGSVIQWHLSEQQGHGDLRWYALYQGLTIVVGIGVLLLFPSRKNNTREFAIAVVGNIAAKLFELLDKPIFHLRGIVSGHTLKHLSAGLSFVPLAFFVYCMIPRHSDLAARGKSA